MPKIKTKVGFRGHVKEIEAEIPDGEPAPWGADVLLKHVGTDVPRLDGVLKVTGRAKYTYDIHPPGMLWGKILHSPWGAAKITSFDLQEAKLVPGVKAVYVFPEKEKNRTVRYHGDEILAVAAETEEAAEEAVRAVKVVLERSPVATTIASAMAPGAPLVFEGEGNVKPGKDQGERAKVDAAIAKADVAHEATYDTQVQTHSSLETHGATAVFEKDGALTLYISTQGTFGCKGQAVDLTKLPDDKVRVVAQMVGGGFGSKFSLGAEGRAAIALAKETRRPVRVMLTREGEHQTGGCRPASVQKMKAGVNKNGKIVAYAVHVLGTGGVAGGGTGAANPSIYETGEKWKLENTVFTNQGPSAAMRSPGHPQGIFALEGFLDELAHAVKMDPLEFRRRNTTDEVYLAQWAMGAEKIGWSRRNKVPGGAPGVIKRGIGMASSIWRQMGGPKCEVDVIVHRDGTVEALNGAQDIGTGTRTVVAVIVAEELGLKPSQIKVSLGDTRWPVGPGSGGSKTAPSIGPAARHAGYLAKQKLLALAAEKLGVPAAELRLEDRLVAGRGRRLTFEEACALIPGKDPIKVRGVRAKNYEAYMAQVHGAQFAEVEVDTETGHVRVVKVVTIQDAGRVIDKLLFESQLVGGVIQGLSYALLETRMLDRNYGPQMNADLMMYKIAGSMEMPEIVPVAFDVANAGNNCGMMGLGEPPNIPTAAAITNAIFNAIGVRLRSLPMTPDKVLAALAAKGRPA